MATILIPQRRSKFNPSHRRSLGRSKLQTLLSTVFQTLVRLRFLHSQYYCCSPLSCPPEGAVEKLCRKKMLRATCYEESAFCDRNVNSHCDDTLHPIGKWRDAYCRRD